MGSGEFVLHGNLETSWYVECANLFVLLLLALCLLNHTVFLQLPPKQHWLGINCDACQNVVTDKHWRGLCVSVTEQPWLPTFPQWREFLFSFSQRRDRTVAVATQLRSKNSRETRRKK